MTGEEYRALLKAKIKQEVQEDLRLRKEFLDKANALRHSQTLLQAVEGLVPPDDTDEWVAKLQQETATLDAKADMALDAAAEAERKRAADLDALRQQAEQQKAAAQDLLAQFKAEMGMAPPAAQQPAPEEAAPEPPAAEAPPARKVGDF